MINRSTGASPQAPGVIPGEITTVLNVENIVIDGDKVKFKGTDEKMVVQLIMMVKQHPVS